MNNSLSPRAPREETAGKAQTPPAGGVGRALRSRSLQVGFSIALAGGLLYLFLRQVRPGPLWAAMRSASVSWLALSLAVAAATYALRAVRWTWLLRPVGRVPFLPALLATAVGFAANNLPAKVGEVIRPAMLARARRLPFSPLLASILFERALDGSSVVVFFLVAAAMGFPGGTASPGAFARLRAAAWIGAVVFAGLIGLAVVLLVRREATERIFDRLAGRLPEGPRERVRGAVRAFPEGFASLAKPKLLASVAAQSLGMWLVINVQLWAMLRALGIVLPFSASFVIVAAAVLGLAVPTPGGIGSYQAAVQYALTRLYGVPIGPASAVAVVAWAISFVPITILGLAGLGARALRPAPPPDSGRNAADAGR